VKIGEVIGSSLTEPNDKTKVLCVKIWFDPKATSDQERKMPMFSKSVWFENKNYIGIIDDLYGKFTEPMFTVKLEAGVKASSIDIGTII